MSRVAFTCLLKQKLKFCSSLTHIFDEKKVSIFFKNKPVWRIFSPGFMFSEMNLWKFRHYFWQFRHYFWKLDFSSTLMLKLMETLFFKLLCRTPAFSKTILNIKIFICWCIYMKVKIFKLLVIGNIVECLPMSHFYFVCETEPLSGLIKSVVFYILIRISWSSITEKNILY